MLGPFGHCETFPLADVAVGPCGNRREGLVCPQRRGLRIRLRRLCSFGLERGVGPFRSFIQSLIAPLALSIFSCASELSSSARIRIENVIPTLSRASLSGPSPKKVIARAATFLASRNAATIDGLGAVVDSISIAAFAAFAAFSSSSILAILPRAAQSRVARAATNHSHQPA
jgi:hypothetical protein